MLCGATLCIIKYSASPLASTHWMPAAPPSPSCDNPKRLQILPDVPGGQNCPPVESPALESVCLVGLEKKEEVIERLGRNRTQACPLAGCPQVHTGACGQVDLCSLASLLDSNVLGALHIRIAWGLEEISMKKRKSSIQPEA